VRIDCFVVVVVKGQNASGKGLISLRLLISQHHDGLLDKVCGADTSIDVELALLFSRNEDTLFFLFNVDVGLEVWVHCAVLDRVADSFAAAAAS
jgi:hypothetical protein